MVKFLLTEEMQKEYVAAAINLFQCDESTEFNLKPHDIAHYVQTLQQHPLESRNTGSKKKELLEGIMSKASVQIMTTLCVLGSRPRLGLARSPKRKASPCGVQIAKFRTLAGRVRSLTSCLHGPSLR